MSGVAFCHEFTNCTFVVLVQCVQLCISSLSFKVVWFVWLCSVKCSDGSLWKEIFQKIAGESVQV